jgi:hypothetical protein
MTPSGNLKGSWVRASRSKRGGGGQGMGMPPCSPAAEHKSEEAGSTGEGQTPERAVRTSAIHRKTEKQHATWGRGSWMSSHGGPYQVLQYEGEGRRLVQVADQGKLHRGRATCEEERQNRGSTGSAWGEGQGGILPSHAQRHIYDVIPPTMPINVRSSSSCRHEKPALQQRTGFLTPQGYTC